MSKVNILFRTFVLLSIFASSYAFSLQKTKLYCVSNLKNFEVIISDGNEVEVAGDFINVYGTFRSFVSETAYFKLTPEHSLKLFEYISLCPARNLQVIRKYKNKYEDFIIVTNLNGISFSNFNVRYNFHMPTFSKRIPFTSRIINQGAQGIYAPNIFKLFLNPLKSENI